MIQYRNAKLMMRCEKLRWWRLWLDLLLLVVASVASEQDAASEQDVASDQDSAASSLPPRAPSLRLSLRRDTDERDVDIRLTFKSLGLVLWLGFGVILLYEILSVLVILLRRQICRQRTDYHYEGGVSLANPPISSSILLLWGISTAYGLFYSFEMIFLYLNDRWYQLLRVQIIFSITDIFAWCWMVGHLKYQLWGKSTPLAKACLVIKFNHLLFNIIVERGIWTGRNLLFCLEDVTCLLLAQAAFGLSLRSLTKPLIASGFAILVVRIVVQLGTFGSNRVT